MVPYIAVSIGSRDGMAQIWHQAISGNYDDIKPCEHLRTAKQFLHNRLVRDRSVYDRAASVVP